MPSRPENIQLAASMLQLGIADAAQIEGYLDDAEAVQIATTLAEKRGAFPTAAAGASEEAKARLTKIAAGALAAGLTTPALLVTVFAAWPDAADVVDIAVGLARKQLAADGRRPPWEPRIIRERDTADGAVIEHEFPRRQPSPADLEMQRRQSMVACSRGAHVYGPPDDFTGWSTCSCGHVLVADRRPGPGGLRANADGFTPQPSLPPRPQGNPQWPF